MATSKMKPEEALWDIVKWWGDYIFNPDALVHMLKIRGCEIVESRERILEEEPMKLETINEEEVIKTPFVPKVIQGGKGPSDPLGPDWLSSLEVNTTFLIQGKKDSNFTLGQATVIYKGSRGVLLLIANQAKEPVWVDPVRFCANYRWYETIQTGEEAREEAELNDSHRTNTNPEVADTEEA